MNAWKIHPDDLPRDVSAMIQENCVQMSFAYFLLMHGLVQFTVQQDSDSLPTSALGYKFQLNASLFPQNQKKSDDMSYEEKIKSNRMKFYWKTLFDNITQNLDEALQEIIERHTSKTMIFEVVLSKENGMGTMSAVDPKGGVVSENTLHLRIINLTNLHLQHLATHNLTDLVKNSINATLKEFNEINQSSVQMVDGSFAPLPKFRGLYSANDIELGRSNHLDQSIPNAVVNKDKIHDNDGSSTEDVGRTLLEAILAAIKTVNPADIMKRAFFADYYDPSGALQTNNHNAYRKARKLAHDGSFSRQSIVDLVDPIQCHANFDKTVAAMKYAKEQVVKWVSMQIEQRPQVPVSWRKEVGYKEYEKIKKMADAFYTYLHDPYLAATDIFATLPIIEGVDDPYQVGTGGSFFNIKNKHMNREWVDTVLNNNYTSLRRRQHILQGFDFDALTSDPEETAIVVVYKNGEYLGHIYFNYFTYGFGGIRKSLHDVLFNDIKRVRTYIFAAVAFLAECIGWKNELIPDDTGTPRPWSSIALVDIPVGGAGDAAQGIFVDTKVARTSDIDNALLRNADSVTKQPQRYGQHRLYTHEILEVARTQAKDAGVTLQFVCPVENLPRLPGEQTSGPGDEQTSVSNVYPFLFN